MVHLLTSQQNLDFGKTFTAVYAIAIKDPHNTVNNWQIIRIFMKRQCYWNKDGNKNTETIVL